MTSSPIRFDIPDECRTFTPFPRLPPELRQQIWRATVSTPGMHFVKLESRGRSWRWVSMGRPLSQTLAQQGAENADEHDEIALEVKHEVAPKQMWDTRLVPLAPTKESDISSYHGLNRQLTTLSVTCKESLATAKSLTSRQGILRLSNGTPVTLENSSDVVFLEYFPPELFESGCSFGIDPNCPGLDLIRRVAVRFCHQWQEKSVPSVCSLCGQVHESTNSVVYPVHLYQFLARHMPNLEEFYFVDYFLLRKAKVQSQGNTGQNLVENDDASKHPPLTLRCGNRTFHEANDKEWNIKSQVHKLKSWLQDRFVRYAKASRLSRHEDPDKVRFGILACEWAIAPPVSLKSPPTTPTPKGRNKRMIYEDHALRQVRRQILRRESYEPMQVDSQVEANTPFLFGNGAQNSFVFTFTVPRR